uniref:Uncharacterized protein n=1 Tax=viral metagenome TaxID=1070528 RepID=A0A6C0HMV2_9ZZZZ
MDKVKTLEKTVSSATTEFYKSLYKWCNCTALANTDIIIAKCYNNEKEASMNAEKVMDKYDYLDIKVVKINKLYPEFIQTYLISQEFNKKTIFVDENTY